MYVYVTLHVWFVRRIVYMALNGMITVGDELRGKKKHVVVACFRVLLQNFLRRTERNQVSMTGIGIQNLICHHNWLRPSWESKMTRAQYETALTVQLWCSVQLIYLWKGVKYWLDVMRWQLLLPSRLIIFGFRESCRRLLSEGFDIMEDVDIFNSSWCSLSG